MELQRMNIENRSMAWKRRSFSKRLLLLTACVGLRRTKELIDINEALKKLAEEYKGLKSPNSMSFNPQLFLQIRDSDW
jgi:hypothetical protein